MSRLYELEEVERGLLKVALCGGNSRKAEAALTEEGHRIPRGTLDKWKRKQHADRYEEIKRDLIPKVFADVANEQAAIARRAAAGVNKAIDRAEELVADAKTSGEAARVAKDLETTTAIAIDKVRLIRGEPTNITATQDQSVEEILQTITRKFPGVLTVNPALIADAEAVTELPDEDRGRPRNTTGCNSEPVEDAEVVEGEGDDDGT